MSTRILKTKVADATVFTFTDAAMDETYGELLCTVLRRRVDAVERASHATDYEGFRVEVVVPRGELLAGRPVDGSPCAVQALKDAFQTRASQVMQMLASLEKEMVDERFKPPVS